MSQIPLVEVEKITTNRLFATKQQRNNFIAAFFGYVLDAMDFLLYAMVISILIREFNMSPALAGLLSSASLIAAAVGGLVFGILSDYIGRKRVLVITIIIYSLASLGAATSESWQQLLFWRILLGIGMGGEWGAGMALVSETLTPQNRGKGVGLVQSAWPVGYILAAVLSFLIVPNFGWRGLFVVGVLPAIGTWWIQRSIQEPELWRETKANEGKKISLALIGRGLFGRKIVGQTIVALVVCIFGYMGYQALSIWLPTFLAGPAKAGGLGLHGSQITTIIIVNNLGALIFFPIFGICADRFGRKPMMLLFTAVAAILSPIVYLWAAHLANPILFYIGIFLSGGSITFFAYYGMGISELFPTSVRGTALGFVNNMGRIIGGQAPVIIGTLSGTHGYGTAMTIVAVVGFVITFLGSFFIRETKGVELS